MLQVFKKCKYIGGKPIPPGECAVENISVQEFFDFYMTIMDRYQNEWILKQYLIYYASAPCFSFPASVMAAFKTDNYNFAEMLLWSMSYGIDPFE